MGLHPVPQDRLLQYQELLGLSDHARESLSRWAEHFLPRTEEFVDAIEAFVDARPQTRIVHRAQPPGKLRGNWRNWYLLLFATGAGNEFVDHVWKSGQAHVVHNIDHRYISMAYAVAREFLHRTAMSGLPLEEQATAVSYADRAVDLSLLVETDAYVVYATQCELEVIQGISHQVRNPVSVIGGGVRKLLRLHPGDSDTRAISEVILAEAVRLERMVRNVNAYMDITRRRPGFGRSELLRVLEAATDKIQQTSVAHLSPMCLDVEPVAKALTGDFDELAVLFACLLENAYRYADPVAPRVGVRSERSSLKDGFAMITITNNGVRFDQNRMGEAFSPFHSSLPTATGFGLPMARVIASKYFGNITLAPLEREGTRCVVTLPLAPSPGPGGD